MNFITGEFYYGLGSRYSYLAFTQFERLEVKHDCRFALHPVSTAEVTELCGVAPFDGSMPSGQYDWEFRAMISTASWLTSR